MCDEFECLIDNPNAPERLRGKIIKAILTPEKLDFALDFPENPTPNEIGYFKWFVGELADELQNKTKIKLTKRESNEINQV